MKKLENFAYKLLDWLMQLYVMLSFILIGVNLLFIINYQFIDYAPLKVLVGSVSLFIMIYTNKEVRG